MRAVRVIQQHRLHNKRNDNIDTVRNNKGVFTPLKFHDWPSEALFPAFFFEI